MRVFPLLVAVFLVVASLPGCAGAASPGKSSACDPDDLDAKVCCGGTRYYLCVDGQLTCICPGERDTAESKRPNNPHAEDDAIVDPTSDTLVVADAKSGGSDIQAKDASSATDTAAGGKLPLDATCTSDDQCAPGPGGCNHYLCIAGKCGVISDPIGTSCPPCRECDTAACVCGEGGTCNPKAGWGSSPCDDGNQCTNDWCGYWDGTHGYACQSQAISGGSCNDGDACTIGDHCNGKGCYTMPAECDDGNPCTADGCNGGCIHIPIGAPCTVAGACGTCVAGACASAAPPFPVDLFLDVTLVGTNNDIAAASDGGLLVIGTVGDDGLGVRLTPSGAIKWAKTWPKLTVFGAAAAGTGGFWLGGRTGMTGGFLVHVDDNGNLGVPVTTPEDIFRLLATPGGAVFALGGDGLSKVSASGGFEWTATGDYNVVQVIENGTGWLAVQGGSGYFDEDVMFSLDASGKSFYPLWGYYSDILYGYKSSVSGFSYHSAGLAYFAGPNGALLSHARKTVPFAGPTFDGIRIDPVDGSALGGPNYLSGVDHIGAGEFTEGIALQQGYFLTVAGSADCTKIRLLWVSKSGVLLGEQAIPVSSMNNQWCASGFELVQANNGTTWLSTEPWYGYGNPLRVIQIPQPPSQCP